MSSKLTHHLSEPINFGLEMLEGKRILITGITGLIGLNLASALRDINAKIYGTSRTIPKKTMMDVLNHLQIFYYPTILARDFDYIFHCAGSAVPAKFTKDPLSTIEANTIQTLDLIDRLAPDGRFIFMSSSEIYSGTKMKQVRSGDDYTGTYEITNPRAIYIHAKRMGEAMCYQASKYKGVKAAVMRLGHIYGPGWRLGDQRIIPQFIDQAVSQRVITPQGNIRAIKAWLYVEDAVHKIIELATGDSGIAWNICSENCIDVEHLAGVISTITGSEVYISKEVLKSSERVSPVGFMQDQYETAKTPLSIGLKRTVQWYQDLIQLESISAT